MAASLCSLDARTATLARLALRARGATTDGATTDDAKTLDIIIEDVEAGSVGGRGDVERREGCGGRGDWGGLTRVTTRRLRYRRHRARVRVWVFLDIPRIFRVYSRVSSSSDVFEYDTREPSRARAIESRDRA